MMNESKFQSQVKFIAISSVKMTKHNRYSDLTIQLVNHLIRLIYWTTSLIDDLLQIKNSNKHHTQ